MCNAEIIIGPYGAGLINYTIKRIKNFELDQTMI